MLQAFTRDSQAQFSLTLWLDAKDLVPLHATCRAWREWLDRPSMLPLPGAALRSRSLSGPHSRVIAASRSQLTRVHLLRLNSTDLVREFSPSPAPLLECIAAGRFSRLMELALSLHKHDVATQHSELEACFDALAPTLQILRLQLWGLKALPAEAEAEAVAVSLGARRVARVEWPDTRIFASVLHLTTSRLPRLIELELNLGVTAGVDADLDCLRRLPTLATLKLAMPRCSAVQARALGGCASLTSIECGDWSAPPNAHPLALTALVDAITAAADRPAPFKQIFLGRTKVCSRVFEQLLRFSTLTELAPNEFLADVTPQQWLQLPSFTALRTLSVTPRPDQVDSVLAGVFQCRQLIAVSLRGSEDRTQRLQLSAVQLRSLCTELPRLESLEFHQVSLPESVDALSLAPRLRELQCWDCSLEQPAAMTAEEREANPWDLLQALPAMAHLDRLFHSAPKRPPYLVDPRPALFARCPMLRPDDLTEMESFRRR